jgi:hypothetical protein
MCRVVVLYVRFLTKFVDQDERHSLEPHIDAKKWRRWRCG